MPLISIIMPVKNTEAYLPACLDSILSQTEQDWELLAVDDGSSDQSWAILESYSQKDSRIQIFKNKGKGIIEALRLAYAQSKGEYITRMDSDDKMASYKLKEMSNLLLEKGKGHIAVGLVEYFSDAALGQGYVRYADWLNQLTLENNNFKEIYKECVIPSPCWMMARKDLDTCGAFVPDDYPEDYDLCFRWRKANMQVAGIARVLHYWRDYPQRTSRNDPNYLDNRFTEMKIRYFAITDYDKQSSLYLWGAGKKGKAMAQALQKQGISFRWICDNPKKIGKDIYGVRMEHYETLSKAASPQVLVSVSSPSDLDEVKTWLGSQGIKQTWSFG